MNSTFTGITKINNSTEINNLFETNKLNDLSYFLTKRKQLNQCNMHLVYFFYIFQSAGILTTTLAAGYDIKYLIWVGVTLNAFASLINIYEKTNNSINDRLLDNINEIRNGTYIDQTNFVDPTDDYTNIISPSIQNPKSPVISPNTELKTLKPNLSLEP